MRKMTKTGIVASNKKEYDRLYHILNREKRNQCAKEWRMAHPQRYREIQRKSYYKHREKTLKRRVNWYQSLKEEVLTYYGGGRLACVKCGFNNKYALTLDHINGNGARERLMLGKRGDTIYRYVKRNNWPAGYQTLCMNCQFIKRYEEKEWANAIARGKKITDQGKTEIDSKMRLL